MCENFVKEKKVVLEKNRKRLQSNIFFYFTSTVNFNLDYVQVERIAAAV